MKTKISLAVALTLISSVAFGGDVKPLKLGVGMFQPSREKNDATYKPLTDYLSEKLGRPVELRTVDTWEGLAKALANGEEDMALLGPWGYVLAHNEAGAEVVSTILYDGKPEYFAIIITNPNSGANKLEDLKGKTFAFADKGSTSGYLIPFHHFQKMGVDPDKFFGKVLYTEHPAIEVAVTKGEVDAGADYNRNRNSMIEQGLIQGKDSKVIWTSDPLPNDAFAVSKELWHDRALVKRIQKALAEVGTELKTRAGLLPPHYGGFVTKTDQFYKPVRDAGLATGKLIPKKKDSDDHG